MNNKKFFWIFFAVWLLTLICIIATHYKKASNNYYEGYESICGEDFDNLMCTVLSDYDEAITSSVIKVTDDYGDSYLFTGEVDNNYLVFGDYLWRIVRLNGNGSIRLIYSGEYSENGTYTGMSSSIGSSIYNNTIDNTTIGYMYGISDEIIKTTTQYEIMFDAETEIIISKSYTADEDGLFSLTDASTITIKDIYDDKINYIGQYFMIDSENYILLQIANITLSSDVYTITYYKISLAASSPSQAQQNDLSSDIKEVIDSWYEENFKDTDYEQYIVDSLYCNDRSINTLATIDYTNKAYSFENTLYQKYTYTDLTCSNKNDSFTYSDNVTGNHSLSYPIGLLTAEEATLAGLTSSSYTSSYLNSQIDYWTMTPYDYKDMVGNVFSISSTGKLNVTATSVALAVRPVISISLDLKIADGDGTLDNPYILEY